jgi:hypothetical protein
MQSFIVEVTLIILAIIPPTAIAFDLWQQSRKKINTKIDLSVDQEVPNIRAPTDLHFYKNYIASAYSSDAIHKVLVEFIMKAGAQDDHDGLFFNYTISREEPIYIQGFISEDGALDLEISPPYVGSTFEIDKDKAKSLQLLGWEGPETGLYENFYTTKFIQDALEGDTAEFLFESLEVFSKPRKQLLCSYIIAIC